MRTTDRRPTIVDVAREAAVSKSTVSLVLQNSPLVREETRAQVRAAMARLGYLYNRAAANLRLANAGLIGVVINDLRNPFFTEFATSVQMALSDRGYAVVIANTDENPQIQAEVVGAMVEHGVSALIVSPAYGDEAATFDILARAGLPTMQVLRRVDPRTDRFPFAAPDYAEGSRLATRHLVDLGARNIAFVGGVAGRAVTEERMSGYIAVLSEAGLVPTAFHGRASRAFGREAADRLQASPGVTAALCFNDLVALGVLNGFRAQGRSVGETFRLAGFDDIEECAETFPGLTSVRCDVAAFGRRIAADILGWLEQDRQPPPVLRTPVSLSVRGSTRPG
jgi:LacI family transcriptional regulator